MMYDSLIHLRNPPVRFLTLLQSCFLSSPFFNSVPTFVDPILPETYQPSTFIPNNIPAFSYVPQISNDYTLESPTNQWPAGYADQSNYRQGLGSSFGVDPRFLTYSPPSGPGDIGSAGSTPPLPPPPFDASGLPFAGLDFLHSFTPGEPSTEVFWQNIGSGAFNVDPEVHFTFEDNSR